MSDDLTPSTPPPAPWWSRDDTAPNGDTAPYGETTAYGSQPYGSAPYGATTQSAPYSGTTNPLWGEPTATGAPARGV